MLHFLDIFVIELIANSINKELVVWTFFINIGMAKQEKHR